MRKGLVVSIICLVILATSVTTFALVAKDDPLWYEHIYELICEAEGKLDAGFLISGFPFLDHIVDLMQGAYEWLCNLFGVKATYGGFIGNITVPIYP